MMIITETRKACSGIAREDILRDGIIKRGIRDVKAHLKGVTLQDFLNLRPPSQVVLFDVNTTISECLHKLDKCNILSAPLFDVASGEYYGFVDRWDILRLVLKSIDLPHLRHEELVYHLKLLGEKMDKETLSILSSLEDGELIHKANECHSLHDIMHFQFLRTHGKDRKKICHRIAIFDFCKRSQNGVFDTPVKTIDSVSSGEKYCIKGSSTSLEIDIDCTKTIAVQAVISHSDILRYMYQQRHLFPELFSMSITDLKISEKPIVCVPADMTAIHTFACMSAFNVTSCGIVDNHNGGKLIANFSASDLRGIKASDFPLLALPVISFLQKRNARKNHCMKNGISVLRDWGLDREEEEGDYPPASTVYPESPLRDAIKVLVFQGYHRVYVVDQDDRPQGIITITDILRLFV